MSLSSCHFWPRAAVENDVKWDFETEHWEALNKPNAKTEGAAASPLGRPQACCASNYTAGQAGPEVNAQVLSLSLTQELGLGASPLYCWNRTLHPRDLRGQGSNDSMASCMTGPQGQELLEGSHRTVRPRTHVSLHRGWRRYKTCLPAWQTVSSSRCARDLKIKSKSPPWVGSALLCNLWGCPREPIPGTFRSVEQLLKCHQSIFDSTKLIMKSVPASSLIIFEILI